MHLDDALELRKFVVPEFVFGARKALVVTDHGEAQAAWRDRVPDVLKAEQIPCVPEIEGPYEKAL
jgi:alcohol dehydrogenase class IV